MYFEPFPSALAKRGLVLTRSETTTLQVNIGLVCNQVCRHCHLDAGPHRTQMMDSPTVDAVTEFAKRTRFEVIDVTGGAPELHPHLAEMLRRFSSAAPKVLLRSNLTALYETGNDSLLQICRDLKVIIIASLPSPNSGQTDSMRGKGAWDKSIATIKQLNSLGYGRPESALELHLVSNPTGAFLPGPQSAMEDKFRDDLQRKSGIVFNSLFTFANAPLGRFLRWLVESDNYDRYMGKLAASFNPCTVERLMCRSLISVSWDGYLYDCDFNLAGGIFTGNRKIHVSEVDGPPPAGNPIAVSDHCYACTAGTGFT
jgi:radical SAM/Cys-rich protein